MLIGTMSTSPTEPCSRTKGVRQGEVSWTLRTRGRSVAGSARSAIRVAQRMMSLARHTTGSIAFMVDNRDRRIQDTPPQARAGPADRDRPCTDDGSHSTLLIPGRWDVHLTLCGLEVRGPSATAAEHECYPSYDCDVVRYCPECAREAARWSAEAGQPTAHRESPGPESDLSGVSPGQAHPVRSPLTCADSVSEEGLAH